MHYMRGLYRAVLRILEVTLKLPKDSLICLDSDEAHHRLKIIKYFPVDTLDDTHGTQGVGAHQDETGWLTFVTEVDHAGLEVHARSSSQWVQVPIEDQCWGLNIGYCSSGQHYVMTGLTSL
jgi:isopenicillin N synthase-like dioxygenase